MSSKKSILIIDDEAPLREALATEFKESGYTVYTASNGQEGVASATKNKPDFILLDLIMPVMDGFQTLEAMNKSEVKSPIMVVSNLGESEETRRAKKMGSVGYIIKSNATLTEIVDRVNKQLD
ncbi:MAG TPA: response regulator [Candidatus Saccharibacteria bacterium]|nr:response regulator [Candidatus Saccharibacteria bacterium]HMT39884.1 response regulator [Candidatus Saccharibacteria bacterium]